MAISAPFPLSVIGEYTSGASFGDDATVIVRPGDDASPPTWLTLVASRLQEIASLADDWDSHGSQAPAAQFLIDAFDRVGQLIPIDAPTPSIYPTSLGGVQFEWTVGTMHVELECLPDGTLEGWGEEFDGRLFLGSH